MFGHQFYPTPEPVIRRMVDGLRLYDKRILDPSAGRGDILDYVRRQTEASYGWSHRRHNDLYAIEIDPDLRQVLLGKDYKVIDTDFLAYAGQRYFDFILMNPPFDQGAKHLLKAWEISNGAEIRCLLNADTLRHNGTRDRQQVQQIVEQYGSVEWLGPAFATADRPTNVEVALVTLTDTRKREAFRLDFDPTTMGAARLDLDDIPDKELASANVFENYEARHRAAVAAFKELLAARQKVRYYLNPLLPEHKSAGDVINTAFKKPNPDEIYSDFLDTTTSLAWDNLFQQTKLAYVTTEGVRGEIEKMQGQQGVMEFTAGNMENLFYLLAMNKEQIMLQSVLEAFDLLTKHYPENRVGVEGWKSNSAYMVGKKFILPGIGSMWGEGVDYRAIRDVDDLEKALCFISGKQYEGITKIRDIYNHASHYGQWMTSEFFETKLFLKRTMHFRWRDDALRDDFNAIVARHRWGELPPKSKKGVYR